LPKAEIVKLRKAAFSTIKTLIEQWKWKIK
jgi:hypothetical protein